MAETSTCDFCSGREAEIVAVSSFITAVRSSVAKLRVVDGFPQLGKLRVHHQRYPAIALVGQPCVGSIDRLLEDRPLAITGRQMIAHQEIERSQVLAKSYYRQLDRFEGGGVGLVALQVGDELVEVLRLQRSIEVVSSWRRAFVVTAKSAGAAATIRSAWREISNEPRAEGNALLGNTFDDTTNR